MNDPFRILVICTGNICRSPAGDLLLQHLLGDTVTVASAGTHAMVGYPVEPQMAALLPPEVRQDHFAARQLTPAILRGADLVLGMTREHRTRAVEVFPAAVRRAFTLLEFARILESRPDAFAPAATPGEFLREATRAAGRLRAQARPADPAADDVADPYRRDDEVFAQSYAEIEAAVHAIARAATAR